MSAPARPRIVWDLDDTLNELMLAWHGWFNRDRRTGGVRLSFAELRENPPHRLLGLAEDEYRASLDRFRLSPAGRNLEPSPAALAWFERHGFEFEHHVLTARSLATVPAAAEWVFSHFGRWIRHFHFIPAVRAGEVLPDAGQAKADVIRELGPARYFVDDNPAEVEAARACVEESLLVAQPWNAGGSPLAELLARLPAAV
ncbi:MAG: hypothetical protein ACREFX_04855 [Opitutaceae bacterium]